MVLTSTVGVVQQQSMERLDAARALLGVAPGPPPRAESLGDKSQVPKFDNEHTRDVSRLDALAALASRAVGVEEPVIMARPVSSSDDDSSEAMPPPPPRRGRMRSVSNPEGMEKWDSLSKSRYERRHFVLPSAILEQELAEAEALCQEHALLPVKKQSASSELFGTSPSSVTSPINCIANDPDEVPCEDEVKLEPGVLLQRARSRLLEDLSEGSLQGEKGDMILPHSLSKYKEVYNRNGRIGIYTPAERAAIIARFNHKRARRVWNKRIRYSCRKNLADRRLRVKGRFVKRAAKAEHEVEVDLTKRMTDATEELSQDLQDSDMPDVSNPEAGFAPTQDQPYRRVRRHTIT